MARAVPAGWRLFSRSSSAAARQTGLQFGPRSRHRRLRVEPLEDRQLLSVATLAADINRGNGSSNPSGFIEVNGALYFLADDGTDRELWKYDGTAATKIDINPSGSSLADKLANINGALYFWADDGTDRELWKYDGAAATKIDINHSGDSDLRYLTNVNGTLYFSAFDGTDRELWKYEGTTATQIDVFNREPSDSSDPEDLTNVNGTLYFSAAFAGDDEAQEVGRELWKYDGTRASWFDINPSGASEPMFLTSVNGTLYFSAFDGTDRELWKFDGTSATKIDINPSGNSDPASLTNVNGTLYFLASDATGTGLWKYDGTTATKIPDTPSEYSDTVVTDAALYILHAGKLWRCDGTSEVKFDLRSPTVDVLDEATDVNGALYFSISDEVVGCELFRCDANTATMIEISRSGDSSPMHLTNVNGTLYFTAYDGEDVELWRCDGTTASKIDINSDPLFQSSSPEHLTNINGTLYFAALERFLFAEYELWTYDGAALAKIDVNPSGGSNPHSFLEVGGTVYFSAFREDTGRELFKIENAAPNTAPTLGNGSLAPVAEDTLNPPGATVASIFAGKFTDPDPGSSLSGIAVVGNAANAATQGVWQYSTDGTHWANLGAVNDTGSALALAATGRVRFLPVEDYFGTPGALSVRGMDDTYSGGFSAFDGAAETRVTVDTTSHGGSTAIADAASSLSTSVTAVNDAPTLASGSLAPVAEDTANPPGATVASIFAGKFSDPDPGASLSGIAVVGNAANAATQGVWQYSINSGTTWVNIGTVNDTGSALALAPSARVRFLPVRDYFGTPDPLTVRGMDDTYSGGFATTVDTTTHGGSTAIADATSSLSTSVTAVAEGPELTGIEQAALPYKENDPATAVTRTIAASNQPKGTLTGAVIQISGNYKKGQDVLQFSNRATPKITGRWNAATGTLTLSGTDTVGNYEKALRAVKYQNASDNPSGAERTVTFQAKDAPTASNQLTRKISVEAVNDAPVLAKIERTPLVYAKRQKATAVTKTLTASDVDSGYLFSATIRIAGNYRKGQDVLSFAPTGTIRRTWDPNTGTLTLTGQDTVANYQKALRAVTYRNTSANPSRATRTVTFQVSDGQKWSKAISRKIQWTARAAIAGPASSVSATRKAQASIHDAALLALSWPAGPTDGGY